MAAVCDAHEAITGGQRAPVAIPRQRTASGVEQLGLFASTAARDTIGGEAR